MNPNQEEFYVGRAVTSLQTMLQTISRCWGEIPLVNPDGIYGPATGAAVTAFQRLEGLPPTGVTDYATWREIRRVFENARVEMEPAAPLDIVLQPNQVMTEGSDNLHVLLIQAMLHILHEVYGNMDDCPLSGVFDNDTVCAVKCLQRRCGMQESGILTKALWQRMTGLYFQAVGDGDRPSHCG